jgi:hypothetical protein
MSDESNNPSPNPIPDPSPNTRAALRELLGLIARHEKRIFALATQVAALQTFLRMNLPGFLGTLYANNRARGKGIDLSVEPTDEVTAAAIEQHYDEVRKHILRLRSKIESDLDTYAVEAMSHDEAESLRQTIDLLERIWFAGEGES